MRRSVALVLFVLVAAVGLPNLAWAQAGKPPASKSAAKTPVSRVKKTGWQAEVHFGSMQGDDKAPATGDTSLGFPGGPIITRDGSHTQGVPSYFFGTGAQYLNTAVDFNGLASTHITPLDPILITPSANHPRGSAVGFRFGHSITSHAYAGLLVDLTESRLTLTPSVLSTIQAASASFVTVMQGELTSPAVSGTAVNSSYVVTDKVGRQLLLGGEVNVNIGTFGRLTPFVGGGGGILLPRGGDVTAMLTGHYQFNLTNNNGVAPVSETDNVAITWKSQASIVKFFDVGVQFHVTRRSGVRAQFQIYMMQTPLKIKVEATPASVQNPIQGSLLRGAGATELQIGNFPGTSLSAQESFSSFEGADGVKINRSLFTVGYFVKF